MLVGESQIGGLLIKFQGEREGGEGVVVSHLLFADDTLVFCENSQEQMTYLSWILIWFKALLVLRIKLDKNELISMGKVTDVDILTTELGCKVRKLPYIYLRLPLGASYGLEVVWDVISRYFLGQAYIFF